MYFLSYTFRWMEWRSWVWILCDLYGFLSIFQIIAWDYGNWEKKNTTLLQISSDWMPSETSETYVQFYGDEMHFLAVHETQLAVYEATKLERVKQVSLSTCIIFNSYMMLTANVELVISCGLIWNSLSCMVSVDHWRFLHKDFACCIIMWQPVCLCCDEEWDCTDTCCFWSHSKIWDWSFCLPSCYH